MKTIYRKLAFLYIIVYSTSAHANANGDEYSKSITKDYNANTNTTLEVVNKYGQIEIENWEKSSIHIDVKITVEHNNRDEANKLLQMINVVFTEEGDLVKAVTEIDEKFGTSNIWFGHGNQDGKKFSIDYKINLPKSLNIRLKNKYGNIVINEIAGLAEIDLKYGNININKLTRGDLKPLNTIVLGYGKASFGECSWLKFNLSYSKAYIQKCKALILVSKYSKASVDKASSIVSESAYDVYTIGNITNFVVTGKYSNYGIQSLAKKLDADIKYSGIQVESIPVDFESIKVENAYGKIDLGIASGANYKLDAEVKYAGIKFPENGRISKISENSSTIVKGDVGDGKSNATVEIVSSYGGVDLIK